MSDEAKWKALAHLEQRAKDAEMEQIKVAMGQPAVEANIKLLARNDELEKQTVLLEQHLAFFIRAKSWGAAYGARLSDGLVKKALAENEEYADGE